jgi:hypothetical protein
VDRVVEERGRARRGQGAVRGGESSDGRGRRSEATAGGAAEAGVNNEGDDRRGAEARGLRESGGGAGGGDGDRRRAARAVGEEVFISMRADWEKVAAPYEM